MDVKVVVKLSNGDYALRRMRVGLVREIALSEPQTAVFRESLAHSRAVTAPMALRLLGSVSVEEAVAATSRLASAR